MEESPSWGADCRSGN